MFLAQDILLSGHHCCNISHKECKRHIENVKEATPKCGALHFKVWDKGSTGSKGDADSRDWL